MEDKQLTFTLDSNEIEIQASDIGLRLTSNSSDKQLLANVSMTETREVITTNYHLVKSYYQPRTGEIVSQRDLEIISLKIVLHYFYMYQLWRGLYEIEKNRDLAFISSDFAHPATADTIIFYFKSAYPKDYLNKCELLLDMTKAQFEEYEKGRRHFFER